MSRTKIKSNRRPRANTSAPPASASAKSDEVLTLAETADYLRVNDAVVLRLVREQNLPGRSVGEDWRFLKSAVADWLGTSTGPGQFWQTHFGALKDDPFLQEIVREAYRKRGRPQDGEP
jgi:excisionase family DNA binding protein